MSCNVVSVRVGSVQINIESYIQDEKQDRAGPRTRVLREQFLSELEQSDETITKDRTVTVRKKDHIRKQICMCMQITFIQFGRAVTELEANDNEFWLVLVLSVMQLRYCTLEAEGRHLFAKKISLRDFRRN